MLLSHLSNGIYDIIRYSTLVCSYSGPTGLAVRALCWNSFCRVSGLENYHMLSGLAQLGLVIIVSKESIHSFILHIGQTSWNWGLGCTNLKGQTLMGLYCCQHSGARRGKKNTQTASDIGLGLIDCGARRGRRCQSAKSFYVNKAWVNKSCLLWQYA